MVKEEFFHISNSHMKTNVKYVAGNKKKYVSITKRQRKMLYKKIEEVEWAFI